MTHASIVENFTPRVAPHWNRIQAGGGRLVLHNEGLRLLTLGVRHDQYSDAQIDDYGQLRRHNYPWQAPLRLEVRARASSPLSGTAGFGFWNNPFSPFGGVPALPSALWFFHASPPSDLPLAAGIAGSGWKCAAIDATQLKALRWAPLAPLILLLNRRPRLASCIWPRVQRDLSIGEALVPAPRQNWRDYMIEWHANSARFSIDGKIQLEIPFAPRGPLGFVAWVDNQWAIATPQGRFGWGLLDVPHAQWLDLQHIRLTTFEK